MSSNLHSAYWGYRRIMPPYSNGLEGQRRRYLYECLKCGAEIWGTGRGMASHKGSAVCIRRAAGI